MEHAVGVEEDWEPRLPLKYPVELRQPPGFDPDKPGTWPRLDGRMEYVGGRLLYMPPSGEVQATVVANLVHLVSSWKDKHAGFRIGTNEAGMSLGGDKRGADVGVWKRRKGGLRPGFSEVPPILAIEVEGRDEDEDALREKTRWYLDHGTKVVWLVLPSRREIIVITARSESRHRSGDMTREHAELPGLRVPVEQVFADL